MKALVKYWEIVREVILLTVATILFPLQMYQQGWSGLWLEEESRKNRWT